MSVLTVEPKDWGVRAQDLLVRRLSSPCSMTA